MFRQRVLPVHLMAFLSHVSCHGCADRLLLSSAPNSDIAAKVANGMFLADGHARLSDCASTARHFFLDCASFTNVNSLYLMIFFFIVIDEARITFCLSKHVLFRVGNQKLS
jgi:hypothetical protein